MKLHTIVFRVFSFTVSVLPIKTEKAKWWMSHVHKSSMKGVFQGCKSKNHQWSQSPSMDVQTLVFKISQWNIEEIILWFLMRNIIVTHNVIVWFLTCRNKTYFMMLCKRQSGATQKSHIPHINIIRIFMVDKQCNS